MTLIDFMPPREDHSSLVRLVVGERGQRAHPRRIDPALRLRRQRALGDAHRRAHAARHRRSRHGGAAFDRRRCGRELQNRRRIHGRRRRDQSRSSCPMRCRTGRCRRRIDAGAPCARPRDSGPTGSGKIKIDCPWDEAVTRSLITLKALTYAPTGGMVAAPTTSLPECIGGARNWDYRFCWLRDATLTLLALMNAGYYEEAQQWRDWLLRAVAGSPEQIQIMYGIGGERRLTEWEVPWLPGYEDSQPVRIGNAAHNQLQLDIFGEVMDALHQARQGGLGANDAGWDLQRRIARASGDDLARAATRASGRCAAARQHFTYSKVMAWVAFDRAIKSAEHVRSAGPVERWREMRDRDPQRRLRARLRRRTVQLRAGLWLEGARCQPAAAAGGRISAARGPAHSRHRRGDRARSDGRRAGAPLRHREIRRRPAGRARGCSWPAASGWSMLI